MEKHSLVFFGGCTGIDKTDLLLEAFKKFNSSDYNHIKISTFFEIEHRISYDRGIIWHEDNWKQYEDAVIESLQGNIRKHENKVNIINQHFATISPYGYLSGVDLNSLDLLLEQQQKMITRHKISTPSFGVILLDTDPKVMLEHYSKAVQQATTYSGEDGDLKAALKKIRSVLGYVSNDSIVKDLEENRQWASKYSTRALAVLGKQNVVSETVYVASDRNAAIAEIVVFLEKFMSKNSGG